jgi:hypothetical protein
MYEIEFAEEAARTGWALLPRSGIRISPMLRPVRIFAYHEVFILSSQ